MGILFHESHPAPERLTKLPKIGDNQTMPPVTRNSITDNLITDNPPAPAGESNPDPVISLLTKEMKHRMGSHLRELWLFGSRARGDAQNTSDYDVLVIVDRKTPGMRAHIQDIEVEILDRHQALVACLLRSEDEWQRMRNYPLARNIERERVRL